MPLLQVAPTSTDSNQENATTSTSLVDNNIVDNVTNDKSHNHEHEPINISFEDCAKALYAPLPSLDDMLDEIQTWRKFVLNGTYQKRAFVPDTTRGDIADSIQSLIDSSDEKLAILNSMDTNIEDVKNIFKAVQATRLQFELAVEDAISDFREDDITKRQFRLRMMQSIRAYCIMAFNDGMKEEGVFGEEPNEQEQAMIERHVIKQRQFVNNLSDVIEDKGISDNEANGKAQMWWNKSVEPMYDLGKQMSGENPVLEWTLGNAEHCDDCLRLNGIRKRAQTWYASGIVPKSSKLKCQGFNCRCTFVRVYGSATRGRIPKTTN